MERQRVPLRWEFEQSAFGSSVKQLVQRLAHRHEPVIVGVMGASGSGKSQLAETLVEALSPHLLVTVVHQDHYFCDFAQRYPAWSVKTFYDRIDFDDPEQLHLEKLAQDLAHLRHLPVGSRFHIPKLLYGTPQRKPTLDPAGQAVTVGHVILCEGIHAGTTPELRAQYDVLLGVTVPEDIRRERWMARNQAENRGVTENMWHTTVTARQAYIDPALRHADVVLDATLPEDELLQQVLSHLSQRINPLAQAA